MKDILTAFPSRILGIAESGYILLCIFLNLVYRPAAILNRIFYLTPGQVRTITNRYIIAWVFVE